MGLDKKKSKINIGVSLVFKVVTMVMVIVVKRVLIRTCGNDVNGLNSLYASIIGFLSVAELGIGGAITFCMYKPIVEKDQNKVAALYQLFYRIYLIIGGLILVAGLAITPFVKYFAKDYGSLDVNFYSTFVLMLISVVLTYWFGAKTSLINAYKENYITTAISSGGLLLQYVLQIVALKVTGSFEVYLICRILASAVQGIITEIVTRKKHRDILKIHRQRIDPETKKILSRSILAMFMHKIGTLLVNTVDSLVISFFVGVVTLGIYSNYSTIATSVMGILTIIFTSITSVLGHLYVEAGKETTKKYCELFHYLNFVLGVVFFLGYYAIIDDLIGILFSPDLIADRSISIVVAVNAFVQFIRRSVLTFKDATGTFYNDRWKPLAEGVANLALSILFVNWLGVTGVIVATIVTNLLICHTIEPYALYKNAFDSSPGKYYATNYGMILMFTAGLFVLELFMREYGDPWKELFVNGFISVGVSLVLCAVSLLFCKEPRRMICTILSERVRRRKK